MKWFWMFPLNVITSLLCYITNPIVVLFANEEGELPGVLKLWQTWDDALDVDWFVKYTAPDCLRYDFDAHYVPGREQPDDLKKYNRTKGCVLCYNRDFTIHERIQRYCCRTLWLTRNCGYGFAFYLFGADHNGLLLKKIEREHYTLLYGPEYQGSPWQFIGKWGGFQVMAGWKLDEDSTELTRSMIAGRIIYRAEN